MSDWQPWSGEVTANPGETIQLDLGDKLVSVGPCETVVRLFGEFLPGISIIGCRVVKDTPKVDRAKILEAAIQAELSQVKDWATGMPPSRAELNAHALALADALSSGR